MVWIHSHLNGVHWLLTTLPPMDGFGRGVLIVPERSDGFEVIGPNHYPPNAH